MTRTCRNVPAVSRYAVMWSGGKDSALALRRAIADGLEIGALVNVVDPATRRVRFHATRAELVAAQAAALGLRLRQLPIAWDSFDERVRAALAELAADGFAGVVFGDIHLVDVRAWYEERVRGAGLEHVEPLWGERPADLVREFVDGGGRAVITCVELARLEAAWLGRVIDPAFPAAIAAVDVDPAGENGEYHSFAFEGPPFRRPVECFAGATHAEAGFLQLDLIGSDAIATAAEEAIRGDRELFAAAVAGRPKAWGALAASGITAYRTRAGRALADAERRAVWAALWRRIEEMRAS